MHLVGPLVAIEMGTVPLDMRMYAVRSAPYCNYRDIGPRPCNVLQVDILVPVYSH